MKVVCTQENLKAGLLMVGRVISPSNSLPILNNLLIKTEDGVLKISSTNLEVAITTSIRCKTEKEGDVTVLAKTFIDLVNNLPNKNVVLEAKEGEMAVDAENYHTSFKTLPAEEFPLIPVMDGKNAVEVESQIFKQALGQVVFAASTNQTQPEISGILLSLQEDHLKLAATDRYRLGERKIQLGKKIDAPQEVIIPHKTVAELIRIIGSWAGNVEMVFNETQVAFTVDQTQIISRLIDGHYPDYKEIIPEHFETTIRTGKNQLTSALRASAVFSQGNNSVAFQYQSGNQTLTVAAEAQDLGKSVADLSSQIEGKDGAVILNYRYVLDCLSVVESEQIIIKILNDTAPVIILPVDQKDYLYLVMPIKS